MTVKSATLVAILFIAFALLLQIGLFSSISSAHFNKKDVFFVFSCISVLRDVGSLVFLISLYRRQGGAS